MASGIEGMQGYDESRFEGHVRHDLLCSICHEVLKDPRTCQNKEHPFCLCCITGHLRRSSTCPECREHLTPQTLKNPPRFLMNILSELRINCEYNDRGCPEYVRLENLKTHVDQCGFAPVLCGNEECGMEINKRDKESHERVLCQFRIAKCHDCREIKAMQNNMNASHDQMKAKLYEMKAAQDKLELSLKETSVKIVGIEKKQDEINNNVNTVKENVEEIRRAQNDMRNQFEKLSQMIFQLLQVSNVSNNGAQASDPAVSLHNAINQDIIILGGYCAPGCDKVLNTVERYNVVEGKSMQMTPLKSPRVSAASCVYNKEVYVAGGYDGQAGTDTIEILRTAIKMKRISLRWMLFDVNLPAKLSGHAVVVLQGKFLVIAGYDWNESKTSNAICEVRLTPPYSSKLLVRMPHERQRHSAKVVNGNIFILGGTTTGSSKDALDSVVVFDAINNECKPCTPLPRAVCAMSTVTWGNMIIVLGGAGKNDQALNDVIMYDTETGHSKELPSMIYKRFGCSAVIMNDVIVAMGGWNMEQGYLNSVETFTIGSDSWKELPEMKDTRYFATAVVIP